MTKKNERINVHLTPTQLLWTAAQATPEITTPTGKVVLLTPESKITEHDGLCFLCGAQGPVFPRKKVIKSTFTDGPYAKQPNSPWACETCAWALSDKRLRNYSLLATPQDLQFPSRAQWRGLLIRRPPSIPYLACVAVSGQKWLHFKGRIGWNPDVWVVLLEERIVQIQPIYLRTLLLTIEALYRVFSKEAILNGEYSSDRIRKYGTEAWRRDEETLSRNRGSRLFELAVFVAQKEGETYDTSPDI